VQITVQLSLFAPTGSVKITFSFHSAHRPVGVNKLLLCYLHRPVSENKLLPLICTDGRCK
jgi:hypothetical protein